MSYVKRNLPIKGSLSGSLWKFSLPKSIEIKANHPQASLIIQGFSSPSFTIELREIKSINFLPYLIWASVILETEEGPQVVHGLPRWRVKKIVNEIESSIVAELERIAVLYSDIIKQFVTEINELLDGTFYIRASQVKELRERTLAYLKKYRAEITSLINNEFFRKTKLGQDLYSGVGKLVNVLSVGSSVISERNKQFIEKEMVECAGFFQQLEGKGLTKEQKISVIAFEDRNLLVAAAGSGKSSTLVGKVGYALYKNLYQPNQIIALAFNREAAQELNLRINKQLKPLLNGVNIKARTFHALGAYIIKKVSRAKGIRRTVANPKKYESRIEQAITTCLESMQFRQTWINFLILVKDTIPDAETFKTEEDYKQHIEYMRQERKKGEPARFRSLSNDLVRSFEELSICNWLYAQGIPFDYEKPFHRIPENWEKFEPDFYYPDIDVYHEHFGLNREGKAPQFRGDYAKQAESKRVLFNETIPGRWFETGSANFSDGTIFELLENKLRAYGQIFRPRTLEEMERRIGDLKHEAPIANIARIIELLKSSGVTKDQYKVLIQSVESPLRASIFVEVIWPILEEYNRQLQRDGKIDFSDMINLAVESIEDGSFNSEIKFVLVDEYQDLSQGRARLIKALLAQYSDSVLFGVGDDWQAINGFAGSDLNLFMRFAEHFGPTHEGYLTNTFRSAQGISDVAAWFIQENENGQKKKVVHSKTDISTQSVVEMIGIGKDEDTVGAIEEKLNQILNEDNEQRRLRTVYLLSRYGMDNTYGVSKGQIDYLNRIYENKFSFEFLTVHKSKGLEADFVFVVGVNGGRSFTFPSTMPTDPLVTALLAKADVFPHADERRLFYVALTRAKTKVIVLFKSSRPSPFVLSLMHEKYNGRVSVNGKVPPKVCIKCKEGFMEHKQGSRGPYSKCSNFSRCKHYVSLLRKTPRTIRR